MAQMQAYRNAVARARTRAFESNDKRGILLLPTSTLLVVSCLFSNTPCTIRVRCSLDLFPTSTISPTLESYSGLGGSFLFCWKKNNDQINDYASCQTQRSPTRKMLEFAPSISKRIRNFDKKCKKGSFPQKSEKRPRYCCSTQQLLIL